MIKKTKIMVGRRKSSFVRMGEVYSSGKSGRPVGIIIGLKSTDVYKVNLYILKPFAIYRK